MSHLCGIFTTKGCDIITTYYTIHGVVTKTYPIVKVIARIRANNTIVLLSISLLL
jgi:hypothetical protein